MVFKNAHGTPVLSCSPHEEGQTIYWLKAQMQSAADLALSTSTVFSVDYDIWHKRFGHPSKDVLRKAPENVKGFPQNLEIPKETTPCPGCAKGKMPSRSFPPSQSRASRPFELIHSDLKEFPVLSYHKHKYFISFLDDFTSHAWIILLHKKSDAHQALRQFAAMVKTQYSAVFIVFY